MWFYLGLWCVECLGNLWRCFEFVWWMLINPGTPLYMTCFTFRSWHIFFFQVVDGLLGTLNVFQVFILKLWQKLISDIFLSGSWVAVWEFVIKISTSLVDQLPQIISSSIYIINLIYSPFTFFDIMKEICPSFNFSQEKDSKAHIFVGWKKCLKSLSTHCCLKFC